MTSASSAKRMLVVSMISTTIRIPAAQKKYWNRCSGIRYPIRTRSAGDAISLKILPFSVLHFPINGSSEEKYCIRLESEAMLVLLTDTAFEPVLREQGKRKISYEAATAYDQLFRTREQNKIERLLEYVYYLDVYISIATGRSLSS
jgi:hypothetical protein